MKDEDITIWNLGQEITYDGKIYYKSSEAYRSRALVYQLPEEQEADITTIDLLIDELGQVTEALGYDSEKMPKKIWEIDYTHFEIHPITHNELIDYLKKKKSEHKQKLIVWNQALFLEYKGKIYHRTNEGAMLNILKFLSGISRLVFVLPEIEEADVKYIDLLFESKKIKRVKKAVGYGLNKRPKTRWDMGDISFKFTPSYLKRLTE